VHSSASAPSATERTTSHRLWHGRTTAVWSIQDQSTFIDEGETMSTHVSTIVTNCFAVLWRIRSIQRSVSKPVLLFLVTALMLLCLDYSSATLAGNYLLDCIQSVLCAAARLICQARRYDHVSPLLQQLHWLSVPERIKYRLAALVYRCRHNMAPECLARDLQWAANTDSRQSLHSSSSRQLIVPRTRLYTVGKRAFGVAAARIWNSVPLTLSSAASQQL